MPPTGKHKELHEDISRDKGLVRHSHRRIDTLHRELNWQRGLLHKREARLHAEQLRDGRLHAPHGAAAGVAWGLDQVGTVEHPPFSNSGPKITPWIRAGGGVPGYAWCQYFANQVLVHGGGPQLMSGYTVAVVQWAREGRFGLKVVRAADAEVGDFLYYRWPGSHDFCDHVGVKAPHAKSLEGNTSPTNAGSQNNGGGVFNRDFSDRRPFLVAVVRPTYAKH
jgi:hypothetical protein